MITKNLNKTHIKVKTDINVIQLYHGTFSLFPIFYIYMIKLFFWYFTWLVWVLYSHAIKWSFIEHKTHWLQFTNIYSHHKLCVVERSHIKTTDADHQILQNVIANITSIFTLHFQITLTFMHNSFDKCEGCMWEVGWRGRGVYYKLKRLWQKPQFSE